MKKERRSFSPEDRLATVQEGKCEGTTATCRKYNLSPSLFAKWRSKLIRNFCPTNKGSVHNTK
jgi:putative transposase